MSENGWPHSIPADWQAAVFRKASVTELFGSCVLSRHWCISVIPTLTACVPVTYERRRAVVRLVAAVGAVAWPIPTSLGIRRAPAYR